MSDLGHEFQTTFDAAPEVDPQVDRVGSRKATAADWAKFASWAIVYPAVLGLIIDVLLFLRGGYDNTITSSTRVILRDHPWIGGLVGIVVGGLATHFFASFDGAALSRPALYWFLGCLPIGYAIVRFALYG